MTRTRSKLLAALALFATLAAAVPARADDTADEADFRFHRGATLYRSGHLEEALSEFLASNRMVRNRNVIFNIARCFEQLKMFNEAWRFYSELIGDEMPADERKELDASMERLKPSLALLEVKTDPVGASVYVNRKDLGVRGQTPLTLALKPGKETAIVEAPGYRPLRTDVVLAIGKTARVGAALERIYGALEVQGDPRVFELRVDDAEGPILLEKNGTAQVLPGHHTVYMTAAGYLSQQLSVEIPAEDTAHQKFKLLPIPAPSGSLVVKANLDGALIRVDGKEVGFTPAVIEGILAGARKVEISYDSRETQTRAVEVKVNERSFIDVRLRYAQPRVVAAERKLTRAEDAPASISVITGDEIRAFGYATLAEALRSVRGLYVSDDHIYSSLGVRGLATPSTYGNRVLVLNDGHVTNELSYGQGFIGREFDADLSEVDRIEIIRGPGSVLYGSAAFFAVVNVVHSVPPEGNHVRAAVTAGSYGEEYGHLSLSNSGENSYVWARGSAANIDGNALYDSPATSGPAAGVAHNRDREQSGHLDLRTRYKDFSLLAGYTSRKKNVPTGAYNTVFDAPGTQYIDRRGFVEANYNHTTDAGFGLDARLSYDAYRYIAGFSYFSGPGADTTQEDWVTGELRFRLPELFRNHIFVGGEAQDRLRIHVTSRAAGYPSFDNSAAKGSALNSNGAPESESVYSAYVGDEITLHKRFRINAALRMDDHADSFGVVFDPRIAVIFQAYEDGTTKLIYGQAFRAPGFAERYYTDYSTTAANPQLQPERITSAELEHTHQLNDEISIIATGFYSRITDLIGNRTLDSGLAQLQNLPGTATAYGIEGEVRWQPGAGTLFQVWYAFAHAEDADGRQPANSLTQSGALRMMYPIVPSTLTFATEFIYNGARPTQENDPSIPPITVGDSLRWNLGFTGNYAKWGLRYGVYAQNLLNEQVVLPGGTELPTPHHVVPQYGRVIRVTVAGTF
jgi:outer membrane receptor for ferrienterochelin and colicins